MKKRILFQFLTFFYSSLLMNNILFSQTPKDTLVIAWEQVPRSYDPRYAIDAESQYLEGLCHCSLLDFDVNGGIIGDLAQAWTWSNSKTLKVVIKDKAIFSDGTPILAKDVKATYDFFLKKDHKHPSPRAGAFEALESIEAKNKEVIFHLKNADVTFLGNLVIGILPEKIALGELIDSEKKVHGCGPFQLENVNLTRILLRANPKYSLGSKAKSSNIEIKIVKDETTRFAKLRKGEIDIAQNNINLDTLVTVEKKYPDLNVMKKSALKTTYLGFNIQDNILKSLEVRKAISLAINRDLIIKYLLKDMATPAITMLPEDNFFHNKTLPITTFDPKEAEKILDKAGFKENKDSKMRFKLSYKTTNNPTRIGIARTIASDLKKIGIEVHVQPLEWGRFKEDVEKGNVQLWSLNWIGFKDPDIYGYAFATESFPPNGGNRGRFSHPELDKLINLGKTLTDNNQRKKTYDRIQEIVHEQAPYAFLFHEENFAVVSKNVKDFKLYADGRYSSLKNAYKIK